MFVFCLCLLHSQGEQVDFADGFGGGAGAGDEGADGGGSADGGESGGAGSGAKVESKFHVDMVQFVDAVASLRVQQKVRDKNI